MSQKVGQGVIFVVTKRTTINRIGDFKFVVIILQLCVISTLIVFQIRFIAIVGMLLQTLITGIGSPPLFGLFLLLSTLAVHAAI